MTVKELIQLLSKMDPNAEVRVIKDPEDYGYYDIDSVHNDFVDLDDNLDKNIYIECDGFANYEE